MHCCEGLNEEIFFEISMYFLVKVLNCMISNSRKCLKHVSNIGELSFISFTDYVLLCKPLQSFFFFQKQETGVLYFPFNQPEVPA